MKKIILAARFIFIGLFLIGCEEELSVRQDALTDYAVDINGTWQLFSISRNGEDLSGKISFTDYTLDLNNDGTFNLSSSKVPFPTLRTSGASFISGNWAFNDDFQPTEIQFSNGPAVVPTRLDQPLFGSNNTTLSITFSLGCATNTYLYQFKKI